MALVVYTPPRQLVSFTDIVQYSHHADPPCAWPPVQAHHHSTALVVYTPPRQLITFTDIVPYSHRADPPCAWPPVQAHHADPPFVGRPVPMGAVAAADTSVTL